MGAACSVTENAADTWTPWSEQEKEENDLAKSAQKTCGAFVAEFVFYGVPIKRTKKGANPTSPIIIEIDNTIINDYADDNVSCYRNFNYSMILNSFRAR